MQDVKKSNFIGHIKNALAALRKAMFPHGYVCLCCGKEIGDSSRYDSLCDDCRATLPYRDDHVCPVCGNYVHTPGRCSQCITNPPSFDKAYAPFAYDGIIRKMIIDYKDRDSEYLKEYIIRYLSDYAIAMEITADYLTYVPSLKRTVKIRGFDHMRTVALGLEANLKIPLIDALERKFHSKDQALLDYDQRQVAVKGAFYASDELPEGALNGKSVILLDDVMTSRATASECARILKEIGASKVIVLTLAR